MADLGAGWHLEEAPPDCGCSGKSRLVQHTESNAACPPTQRGGYTAIEGCTLAWRAARADQALGIKD